MDSDQRAARILWEASLGFYPLIEGFDIGTPRIAVATAGA